MLCKRLRILLLASLLLALLSFSIVRNINTDTVHASSTLTLSPNAVGTYSQFVEVPNSGFVFGSQFEADTFAHDGWTGTASSSGGSASITSSLFHSGLQCANLSATATVGSNARMMYTLPSAQTTLYVRCYIQFSALPAADGSNYPFLINFRTGDGDFYPYLYYSSAHGYYWKFSGQGLSSQSAYFTAHTGQWYCLEMEVVKSATVGEAHLWVDGTATIDQTGVNTGANTISAVWFRASPSPTAGAIKEFFDCIALSTSGPIGVENRPTLVNDSSDNTALEVLTYTTEKETENLADHTSETGAIDSLTVYCRAKTTGSTSDYFMFGIKSGATYSETGAVGLTTSFAQYSYYYPANPTGGNHTWTWAEVDALELGSRASTLAATKVELFSEYWIVVTYSTSTPYTASLSVSWTMGQVVAVVTTWHSALTQSFSSSLTSVEQWVANSAESLGFTLDIGTGLSWVAHTAETLGILSSTLVVSTLSHIIVDFTASLSVAISSSITSTQSWVAHTPLGAALTAMTQSSQGWAASINSALGLLVSVLMQVVLNGGSGGGLTQAQLTAGYALMAIIGVPAAVFLIIALRRR